MLQSAELKNDCQQCDCLSRNSIITKYQKWNEWETLFPHLFIVQLEKKKKTVLKSSDLNHILGTYIDLITTFLPVLSSCINFFSLSFPPWKYCVTWSDVSRPDCLWSRFDNNVQAQHETAICTWDLEELLCSWLNESLYTQLFENYLKMSKHSINVGYHDYA